MARGLTGHLGLLAAEGLAARSGRLSSQHGPSVCSRLAQGKHAALLVDFFCFFSHMHLIHALIFALNYCC